MTTTAPEGARAVMALPEGFDFATLAEREDGHGHVIGRKCDACLSPEPAAWYFAGGAQTFDEFDQYVAASEVQQAVEGQMQVFEALLGNIRQSETLDARGKAMAIAALASDLDARIAEARAEEEAEAAADGVEEAGEASIAEPTQLALGQRAAAPTKTEGGTAYRASDYADVGDPEKPSTWKLRLAEGRSGNFTVAQVARAITAMQPGGFRGQKVELTTGKGAVVAKISAAIGKAKGDAGARKMLEGRLAKVKSLPDEDATTEDTGFFAVFKDAAGRDRWTAIHTNRYRDREGDIFAEKAHRDFVESQNAGRFPWPTLRPWHIPFDIGDTDFLDYDTKGFVVSSGTFRPGMERVVERLKSMSGLGCSHGYLYRPSEYRNGVYEGYRSFEISVLPVARAANTLTAFFAGKETEMPLTPARKDFLAELTSPEIADAIERNVEGLAVVAGQRGLSYKELGDDIAAINDRGDAIDLAGLAVARKDDDPVATAEATTADAPGDPAGDGDVPEAQDDVPLPDGVETPSAEDVAAAAAALAAAEVGDGRTHEADDDNAAPMERLEKSIGEAFLRGVGPLEQRIDAMESEQAGFRAVIEAQAAEIERLRGGIDTELAERIRPRIGPISTGVRGGSAATDEEAATIEKMRPTAVRGAKDAKGDAAAADYVSDALAVIGRAPVGAPMN